MRKAFISYARANRADVEQLDGHLEKLGWDSWMDSSLHGGQDWWQEILNRIAACDVFIAAVSRESLNSHACSLELDWAEALHKPVLPVKLERTAVLPGRISRRHIVDYSDPAGRDQSALQLGGGLNSLPPAPPTPHPAPRPPQAPLSYLTGLIDLVASPRTLTQQQQHQVLARLEPAFRSVDPEERQGGRSVLAKFASRPDLYPDVQRSIAHLRRRAAAAERPAGPAAAPRPSPLPAAAKPAGPRSQRITGLAAPAILLILAAVAGIIPPIVARADYQHYPFGVWYLQTASWLLIGIAFCSLGSKAAVARNTVASGMAWLMAPAFVLYVVNDLVWVTLNVSRKADDFETLYHTLSEDVYPSLLGVMALIALLFGLAAIRHHVALWAVGLIAFGVCGLIQAYLARGAKLEPWTAPEADSTLIVQNVILFAAAMLMMFAAPSEDRRDRRG